ncbi:XrtA/PEP-CTERM system histidine kinase PrsK [Thalassomonas actiniarum]|uniref:histidine kinase n=1 Tax=Thalassomonas actiniarum TaxID=485447 RepID=A0AAF0C3D3_9GAMM|nr:XrtA/PEP-CTERM system histidine kinase PrsK [Thalassomonas actiniarum]WDD99457.1 PEP-CTERM system histidine kinase PrsK [Thalassomonas actiniarum]
MQTVGFFGYSLGAVAFFVFSLLLVAARNHTVIARWILFSTLTTVVANLVAAVQVKSGFSLQWVMLADAVKIASWSVLILSCNVEVKTIRELLFSFHVRQYLGIWSVLMLVCAVANNWLNYSYEYLFLLFVLLNLWVLVLLEQLYRSADLQVRWAIWPLVIALASMAIFDFVLYAQATMVEGIDFDFWYSRGFISTMMMPLLLVTTRRINNGAVRVFVSRNVVFYSSILMIAGLYLLMMAFAGYVINYIGGEWGTLISIIFLILGGVVLAVLLITESLRRKLKVFIAKNFFANKYEYRDEWLNLIETLETTSAESHYQMATRIMISKLNLDGGAIVKRVTDLQFKVEYAEGLTLDDNFNQQMVLLSQYCQSQGWIVDIQEYVNSPGLYPELSLDVEIWLEKKIALVVPIFIGRAFYGMFILSGHEDVKPLNWEDRDLMFAISKQLGNFLSLHEANDKLAESKQFDAFNRMSAFLVHDLKNVQAQLTLITTNAQKHRDNPAFIDDVFETVESASERLSKVLSQLRNKQLVQSQSKVVDIAGLIDKVVQQCNVREPRVQVEQSRECLMPLDGETFFSILNHLIQNAQEATKSDGWVKVSLEADDKQAKITISDNGTGMSEEFINKRLFKPFDTTKGNAGMGIGVFEARQFIHSIAGKIDVASEEGRGTEFCLTLPIKSL